MSAPRICAAVAALLLASAGLGAGSAHAADEPVVSAEGRKAARDRFNAGVALYRAGKWEAALAEFDAAYKAAPNWRVRYNLAQVEAQLHDYPEAMRQFELYLEEGGSSIPTARRKEVEAELARIGALVATVSVDSPTPEARVFIDDVDSGAAPITRRVNVGPHTIRIVAEHHVPVTERVLLSPGEARKLEAALEPAPEEAAPPAPVTRQIIVREGPPPTPRAWVRARWAFGVTTVFFGAAAGVAGGLALSANNALGDALTERPANASRVDARRDDLRAASLAADVLTGVAAISLVGLVVSLLGPFDRGRPRATLAPQLGPGAPRVSLELVF